MNTCPECRQGKHANCTGWVIDDQTDDVANCGCVDQVHPWNKW